MGKPAMGKIMVITIIAILVIAGAIVILLFESGSTFLCSGFPPGGNCPGSYSSDFTISISYAGPWKVNYTGYNNGGPPGHEIASGSFSGTGNGSRSVILTGLNNHFLFLCATAQELDDSNSTLTISVTGSNQTSVAFGSVTYCGGVAP
jgi:hypothetical protein